MKAPTAQIARYLAPKLGKKITSSNLRSVETLLDILFFTSLKTDESRPVICTVTFVNSSNPAGSDPRRIRPQRRTYVPITPRLALTTKNLAKLAQATPPWASCVAVCDTDGALEICGLFDQEIHYRNHLNQEGGSRFPRPGLFQIEITGVASLAVYDDRKLICTLNQNCIVRIFHDVLISGPISSVLSKYSQPLETRVRKRLQPQISKNEIDNHLADGPNELFLQTLSRVLLSIKRLKHGGALLIIPEHKDTDLNIKFRITYDKTEEVLEQHLESVVRRAVARDMVDARHYADASSIPIGLHFQELSARNELSDAIQGELGCAHFIASLAGVDGLILMAGGLFVRGFGVEITRRTDPPAVFVANDERATKRKLKKIDFTHFGTRHRSMMRYCFQHKGSVGFVISQDGDIRAMTRVRQDLVLWENIRLQEVDLDNDEDDTLRK